MSQAGVLFVLICFILVSLFLSGICLALYLRLRRTVRTLYEQQEILAGRTRAAEPPPTDAQNGPSRPPASSSRMASPSPPMNESELKSRLADASGLEMGISEKYRYIADLERSGLGPPEIADILDVSQNEARQMLALSRTQSGARL